MHIEKVGFVSVDNIKKFDEVLDDLDIDYIEKKEMTCDEDWEYYVTTTQGNIRLLSGAGHLTGEEVLQLKDNDIDTILFY